MQNASLDAFLYLEGVPAKIPLDASHYEWRQHVDHHGRPRSKVRAGLWSFATSQLDQASYQHLLDLMLQPYAVVDARACYGRADGQGTFVTVWGRQCSVCHVYSHFDARGTQGHAPSWTLYFSLAPQEMGREAGLAGSFVMPAARSYAYSPPAAVAGPLAAEDAWLDDLEKLVGFEARGKIKLWVAGGLDEKKLKSAIRSTVDPKLVFDRLKDAEISKGIYQQRVVIDDYTNIPGVEKKRYLKNGLPQTVIPASNFGVDDPAFDLPARNAPTFTGSATLVEMKLGEKLYRVTSDPTNDKYAKTGGYWTRTPPATLSQVIGGTAVMPEWNNFQRVYEFTVPPCNPDVKLPKVYVWEGPTAAQPVSAIYDDKTENGHCLTGGEPQVFVPNKISRHPDFGNYIQDVTHLHKSW